MRKGVVGKIRKKNVREMRREEIIKTEVGEVRGSEWMKSRECVGRKFRENEQKALWEVREGNVGEWKLG